jgi:hypothetical protein
MSVRRPKDAVSVVRDARPHQRLLDIAAHADSVEGICQGLAVAREGRMRPAREFFEEFEAEPYRSFICALE